MNQTSSSAPLKLTVEWIPSLSKGQSLRKQLSDSRWKKIREQVYADYGQQCAICETSRKDRRLDCHEVWDYDDETHIRKLKELIALCFLCHSVKGGLWVSRWTGEPEGTFLARNLESTRSYREKMAEKYREELHLPENRRDPERMKAFEKMANRKRALEHFVEINGCDLATGERYLLQALEEWRRRSRYKWQIDFGEFTIHLKD